MSFRQEMAAAWPGVGNEPANWRMLGHLIFSPYRDEMTGQTLISQSMLADIEGRQDALLNRNYSGRKFLDRFSETVAPLRYSDWSYEQGKCRMITHFDVTDTMREALARERQTRGEILPLVYLSNGYAANGRNRCKKLAAEQKAAMALVRQAQGPDAPRLLAYMNDLPPRRFTETVVRNMAAARCAADALPTEEKRCHAHDMLDCIEMQPTPFYAPSLKGRTVRIFPCNESILLLNGGVRRALTPDWTEVDLASSQLAIVAATWDIPNVRAFLRTGRSVWDILFEHLDIAKSDANKRLLKDGLYALIFGMLVPDLKATLDKAFGIEGFGERFLCVPLMRDLLAAREKQIDIIKAKKGAYTVYGTWLPIEAEEDADEERGKAETPQSAIAAHCPEFDDARAETEYSAPDCVSTDALPNAKTRALRKQCASIMACCAQAVEMWLLAPIIDAAIENKNKTRGFTIMLWQHDGLSLVSHCASDRQKWVTLLQRMVQERADQAGILTRLEVKQ